MLKKIVKVGYKSDVTPTYFVNLTVRFWGCFGRIHSCGRFKMEPREDVLTVKDKNIFLIHGKRLSLHPESGIEKKLAYLVKKMRKIIIIVLCGIVGTLYSQPRFASFYTSQYDIVPELQKIDELQITDDGFSSIVDSLLPYIYSCEANQKPYCFKIIYTGTKSFGSLLIEETFFSDAVAYGTGYFYRDSVLFIVCGEITDDSYTSDGFHIFHRKTVPDSLLETLFVRTGKHDYFKVYNKVPIMSWHPNGWHYELIDGSFFLYDKFGPCNYTNSQSVELPLLSFQNANNATCRMHGRDIVICEVPEGYEQDGIRLRKGHGLELIIPYKDSSILYISDDIYENPNTDNIERLHTIESFWRNHFRILSAMKEKGVPDELKQQPYNGCNFTYSELFGYFQPETVDLYGVSDTCVWRDVLIDDICIGYIVYDSSVVEIFNHCIETTVSKMKRQTSP